MHTARFVLSKALFELSEWGSTEKYYYQNWMTQGSWQIGHGTPTEETIPAYDLGYLIRKLPVQTVIKREYDASPELPELTPAYYRALYDTARGIQHYWLGGDTPEDAACRLAIELFKHGILTKDTRA